MNRDYSYINPPDDILFSFWNNKLARPELFKTVRVFGELAQQRRDTRVQYVFLDVRECEREGWLLHLLATALLAALLSNKVHKRQQLLIADNRNNRCKY